MNFVGTQKRVRISHGERAIAVRAIEVRLYSENSDYYAYPHSLNSNQENNPGNAHFAYAN